jgi:tetratricopeptide (TPR) repeat protein
MSKKSRARAVAKEAGGAMPIPEPNTFPVRGGSLLSGGIIVLAALAAYSNSFSGPFVLDDQMAITDNPTIRHFGSALFPPLAATTGGRPLLNLSFALNYALNGFELWGYHAFNLLVHVLAGLTLFGVVRRTLECGRGALTPRATQMRGEGTPPTVLALAVAVIWVVHPLQTEAVTYISQRAESLMGLFYLLTLYCFIRGMEGREQASGVRRQASESIRPSSSRLWPDASGLWFVASILACLLGVMSKEIIVTAPVMVFLYDRTFVAGSFRAAWQQRWRYYLGLAGTWLPLACLMAGLHQRHAGFDQGVSWWSYALTSCRSVVLYLKLAVWPHPLVLYYGTDLIQHATEAAPYALILAALLAGVVIALRYRPAIGFAGAWFFVILAPTSSVVPLALQPMGEHRVYLSLASVVASVVLGLYSLIGRRSLVVFAAVAVGLGWLTIQRNRDYGSELAIWSDTVAKRPDNAWARSNLGTVLQEIPGRLPDAVAEYEAALQIDPALAATHYNLGLALARLPGRLPDAITEYRAALRMDPDLAEAHCSLGRALLTTKGGLVEAIAEFTAALRIKPDYVSAHINLGSALAEIPGRLPEAIAQYGAALKIDPASFEAHCDLGDALAQTPGRLSDAISEYETALRIKPDSAEAHFNLGGILANAPGRMPDAIAEYETALLIKPDFEEAHTNLGIILINIPGRLPEAIKHFEAAVQISPNSPTTQGNLRTARQALEKSQETQH